MLASDPTFPVACPSADRLADSGTRLLHLCRSRTAYLFAGAAAGFAATGVVLFTAGCGAGTPSSLATLMLSSNGKFLSR